LTGEQTLIIAWQQQENIALCLILTNIVVLHNIVVAAFNVVGFSSAGILVPATAPAVFRHLKLTTTINQYIKEGAALQII
jgi:hypothetical protein